jgi:hypothetical protein
MTPQRYKLGLGDGAYGPRDIGVITVLDEGNIAGPTLPNWKAEYMLARCLTPTSYYGQEVTYLVLSPRVASVALTDLRRGQAVVAVGRVLPGFWDVRPQQFEENEVEYWAVGVLRLDEEIE